MSSKTRLLVIEPSGLLWGSERALLDLLAALDRERFDILVVCPPDAPLCQELKKLGIRQRFANIGLLHRRGRLARLRALLSLRKIIRSERPDVIHVNQAGLTRIVVLAARRLAPVVSHVRMFEDAAMIRRLDRTSGAPGSLVAISRAVQQQLHLHRRLDAPTQLIHDPFDVPSFQRAAADRRQTRRSTGIPEEARVVAMVGRICEQKGQRLFLEAIAGLQDSRVHALIVGGLPPGDDDAAEYWSAMVRYTEWKGLQHRVHFLGARQDVAALIAASDVLALASHDEAFGRVLLEALAVGVPIVAPRGGGAAEIVGADERGLSYEPGNAISLAEAITCTFKNEAAARERTEAGLRFVQMVCDPGSHAAAMERVFADAAVSFRVVRHRSDR